MLGAFLDAHPLRTMIDSMPVCPFPAMEDRAAWQAIDPADRADLLAMAEELKDVPYPMCTASQFMAFAGTGSRAAYEEPYFLRRRKLVVSVLQLCFEGGGEALADVIDGVWCICEESSWVISAHNVNAIPGAPSAQEKPLPDVGDPYIDLFAAQTGMILALTDALAGKALDEAAPVLRQRIRLEIERRILTPFMTRCDFWWMGFIRRDLCNWTPWIVSNVLIAASLMLREPLDFARLLERGCRMLDRWLDVMPQDGGCDEGTAYYNMAGGALLDCLELLERATQGGMALWSEEKIRNILAFPLRTQLPGGWFVNFADCDARPYLSGERIQTAGEKLGDPALTALGMAAAYGAEAGVLPFARRLELASALTLRDRIDLQRAREAAWVFMLRFAPRLAPGCAEAGRIRIRFDERLKAKIEEIPVRDARMAKNFPGSVWRLPGGRAVLALWKQGIIHGTDPAHEEYWGDISPFDQRMVEMAVMGMALCLIPERFYGELTAAQQDNLYRWMNQINLHDMPKNNWRFFRVLVNVGFMHVGRPVDQARLDEDLALAESHYVADGWYFDKATQRDYYTLWAFHYYGLVYARVMEKRDPERAALCLLV